jgi:hypothetical protein
MKKGELRVVVKEPGALSGPGYCGDCARKMLDLAEERIAELRAALG